MLSFWTILSATAPVFLILGVGFLFQRRGWLSEAVEVGVVRLALNLLVPCLILTTIPGNPGLQRLSDAFWAIGFGFGAIVVGFGVAALVATVARFKKGDGLRTFTICTGIQNYGYLPIPIIAELFSTDSGPMGLVFVHGVGVELAMWGIGLMILTRKAGLRSMVNGPFIAVMLALLLNYTGIYRYIPRPVDTAMSMLGQCAVPISVLMIGATIGRFFQKEVFTDAWRVGLSSVLVRMILLPALILLAVVFLPAPLALKQLMIIQAAMPAAVFPIILARMYGGSPPVAIQVVLATSLVSVVSSPILISLGLSWLAEFG